MSVEKFRVSVHRHYYRIAVEQRRVYSELDAAMSKWKTGSGDEGDAALEKQQEHYEKREQAAVIGITFAAIFRVWCSIRSKATEGELGRCG